MEIRAARKTDVIALCGDTYRNSMRAITVEHEGRAVAIAGVMYSQPAQCFSVMTDVVRSSPKTIIKVSRALTEILNQSRVPVYAMANKDEPTAERFLSHIGFTHLTTTFQGEVYLWPIQSQQG